MGRPAKYPAEFRREAIALVKSSGRPVAEVARSLEIAEGTLWNWVKLDREATDVTIEVVNSLGKVVQIEKASGDDLKAGDHTYSWNGKDRTGAQLPNGETYTLRITAKDSAGATVGVTNFIKGVVTGVEQSGGKTFITVNGVQIGWEKVTSIADVQKTATADPPASDNQDDEENPPSEQAA